MATTRNMEQEPRSSNQLHFDPDDHPQDTLKVFNEFCESFTLRYNALYPDPPKVSMDSALARWVFQHATNEVPEPKPTLVQYDEIRDAWRSKDKVLKFLGLYSSKRFQTDWIACQPNETLRNNASWTQFQQYIRAYYKATENSTLKHFQFRGLSQFADETYTAYCN